MTHSRLAAAAAADDSSYDDNYEDENDDNDLDMPILPASLAVDVLGLGPVISESSPGTSGVHNLGPGPGLISPPGLAAKVEQVCPPGFSSEDLTQLPASSSSHSGSNTVMECFAQFLCQYYSGGAAFRFDKLNDFYVLYPEYRGKVNKRLVEQEGRALCIEWVNPPPGSSSGCVRWLGNSRCVLKLL